MLPILSNNLELGDEESLIKSSSPVKTKKKKKSKIVEADGEKSLESPEEASSPTVTEISSGIRKVIERRLRRQTRNSLLLCGYIKELKNEGVKDLSSQIQNVKWINYIDQLRVTFKSREAADQVCSALNDSTYRDQQVYAVPWSREQIPPNDSVFMTFSRGIDPVHVNNALPQAENVAVMPGRSYTLVKFESTFEAEQAMKSLEDRRIAGCIPITRFSRHQEKKAATEKQDKVAK